MSAAFDSLQSGVDALSGDRYLKSRIRFAIDALHSWDHAHEGVLNRLVPFSAAAREAEEAAQAPKPQGSKRIDLDELERTIQAATPDWFAAADNPLVVGAGKGPTVYLAMCHTQADRDLIVALRSGAPAFLAAERLIDAIDLCLRVPAAEYVSSIQDVFRLIDEHRQTAVARSTEQGTPDDHHGIGPPPWTSGGRPLP